MPDKPKIHTNTETFTNTQQASPMPRQKRKPLPTSIEFIGDFDLVEAHGVNISEGGICFEVQGGLPFEMRFQHQGKTYQKRGQIAWVKKRQDGSYQFGFMFVPPETYPIV